MFIRPIHVKRNGKRYAYWALVESYRSERGPRQRTVAHLGQMDKAGRLGIKRAAQGEDIPHQRRLFDDVEPEWIEVDIRRVRVERCVDFGGPWLGLKLCNRLGLISWLRRVMPEGREEIPWSLMGLVLVLSRLCHPCSELHIAEHFYGHTALNDLLGVAVDKVNEDRLYRALDKLLSHKEALERHLKERLGTLFNLEHHLLLYDITSTYFEGEAKGNSLAQYGYSQDRRSDCKQVCIGLAVSRCGIPLGYEVFAGNRSDVTTVEEIVGTMEARYGKADRIWVMDRGMVSERNIEFLKRGGRRYIVGTPKGMLKKFERDLLREDWDTVHKGLEVKLCPSLDGDETFILCRSRDRREKEKAMHEKFEKRLEARLKEMEKSYAQRRYKLMTIAKRLGKLLGRNNWAQLSKGCYLLRSNVNEWDAEDLWKAYMQLTEAEAAFRIHKSDLSIRPIWHQKAERVAAHILVCFLAYVLWKTLGQVCHQVGLGDEPRRVLEELSHIKAVDVILPTKSGTEIRRRCISHPTDHQAILLHYLGLSLPQNLQLTNQK